MRHYKPKITKKKKGMYLPLILLSSVIFMALATAIINMALTNVKMANLHNKKITSMSIAEAGINYYMWHLAHDSSDFCDGNTCSGSTPYGPFHHDYTDQSGVSLGTFDLFITPPSTGGSTVTVKSVGKVKGKSPTKSIVSEIGMPSFAKYSMLLNNNPLILRSGEKINGTAHANYSYIQNEGEITGDVSSTERENSGLPGIRGNGIFGGAKLFPVPPIDFNKLDQVIQEVRTETRDLEEGDYYNVSGSQGYHIILKANSYDMFRVTKYDNQEFGIINEVYLGNHQYPEEGVVFCEDNIWVEGLIENQKISIFAADPEASNNQKKKIYITNSLRYTNMNGKDKLGLISQTGVNLVKGVPSTLEIDAAIIAKDGDIKINNFGEKKNSITINGSLTAKNVIWRYYDNAGIYHSGFGQVNLNIDQYNVLNPPPKFPLTGTYAILSWREE